MSIDSGYIKYKKYMKQENGNYKLISFHTHGDTVHLNDGSTVEEKCTNLLTEIDNVEVEFNGIIVRIDDVESDIANIQNDYLKAVDKTELLSSISTNTTAISKNTIDIAKNTTTIEENAEAIADNTTAIAVERARIDAFTALPEGSTTGDAALEDIKIKVDGTTADTAGNAVREQITALDTKIDENFSQLSGEIERISSIVCVVPENYYKKVISHEEIVTSHNIVKDCITIHNDYVALSGENTEWHYFCYSYELGKVSDIEELLFKFNLTKTSQDESVTFMCGVNLSGKASYSTANLGSAVLSGEFINPCEILKNKFPDSYNTDSIVYLVVGMDFDYPTEIPENTLSVEIERTTNSTIMANELHPDLRQELISYSKWSEKTVLFWGDSITAQGNNGGTFYGTKLLKNHGMTGIVRGVGGQTYKKNTTTFYANADGSYAGRYGKNGLTEAPEGTTEHLGYFCSWDRITAMIPEDMRETIDLVILNGGTNDHKSVEDVETDGIITPEPPLWVTGSVEDVQWSESTYYNGGDYNISTFVGAIASTIMKMRLWCPNALVILVTPFPRWKTDGTAQYENEGGLIFREMCEIEIATAKYMGCPVIDANASCNISGYNFMSMVTDGTHPNENGKELYGQALSDGLSVFTPR